ncbi:AAA family ATPase [Herbivorax sp. ANBcel31]|uniref:AAA family ATPase n=1 Tax=Herbivorax sp. ANBcel31 TaxID=3069754 RepID=UPI0027B44418|nr:AAA family ATPase [Herbivorax sp. ANBcel31]MDQ2088052.1 AAA family ATPase [Herbivorax sp. ANBcel31]
MELIYLYIKKYDNFNKLKKAMSTNNNNFEIKNTGFNFSDSFECHFDEKDGLIIIKEKYCMWQGFYGKNIKSFKVLAGRNGSGKTTILDIIGMLRDERCDDHLMRDQNGAYFTAEYFFIYHMKENQFLIEVVANIKKEDECWIKNIEISSIFRKDKNMHYKLPIGYTFEYDYDENRGYAGSEHCFNDYAFKDEHKKKIAEHANIYYFSNYFSHRKTNSMRFKPRKDRDDEYLIKRQELRNEINEPNDFLSLYKIMFSKKYEIFVKKIINTKLMIQMTDSYSNEFLLDNVRLRFHSDENIKKNIDELENSIKEIRKKLYRNIGLPDKSSFFATKRKKADTQKKRTKNKEKYNQKQKYLLDLSYRYILCALNSLVEMTYENSPNVFKKDEINELTNSEIKSYLDYIRKNDYVLCNAAISPFKEIADFKKMVDVIYGNLNGAKEVKKILFEQKYDKEFENDSFKENLINNIILGRYLLIKIESQVKLGESSMYQTAFEEILMQLFKLEDSYFYDNGVIINSDTHKDDTEIISFFEMVSKWYKYESDHHNDIWNRFKFVVPYVSDGERCILDIFSKFINILENEDRTLHIILMDEPDQRLHPEWSRQFVYLMLTAIRDLYLSNYETRNKELNVQLIISTHSPFILSDIRKEDLLILNQDEKRKNVKLLTVDDNPINTFSANIYDILNKSFFLDDTIGEFAKEKIETNCKNIFKYNKDEFLTEVKYESITKDDLEKLKYLIEQISEPIMRKSLVRELDIRYKWIAEYDAVIDADDNVDDIFEQFSRLDNEKKKKFIKKLIMREGGGGYD